MNTLIKLFLSALIFVADQSLHAQFADNFSDGDFTGNPPWAGELTKFEIANGQLHLNAPAVTEAAFLSTPSVAIHLATWEFYVEMGFPTSSTSLTRVYLVSDQADLTQPLNGYFVMIGNTTDEVSLFKQTGTTSVKIIDGLDARVDFPTVLVNVKITRDASGNWTLFSDCSAEGPTGTYTLEGTTTDVTHTVSSYFGLHCTYIASRSTLFHFDDFRVTGTAVPDRIAPTVNSVQVLDQNNLLVNFSEPIDVGTGQAVANYSLSNGIGSPARATIQADKKSVALALSSALVDGMNYSIQISGVQDLAGNPMTQTTENFFYALPQPVHTHDVVVSEIMADPTPVVGLPEAEYVELYNRSVTPLNLSGWTLRDGSSVAVLPNYALLPATRCVLTATANARLFPEALGVASFPSLNNAGDDIVLRDDLGNTIDSIHYSMAWYHSDEKKDGGWSLEIIDPENLCEEEGNWTSSESSSGGTPGAQNSVAASNPDLTAPVVRSVIATSPSTVEISFSEKMDKTSTPQAIITPAMVVTSIRYESSWRKLLVRVDPDFQKSTPYTITLSQVYDCSGNRLGDEDNAFQFALPEIAEPGDFCINEVLFNPKPGGVDFVEVYNRSDKYLDMSRWVISNYDNGVVGNAVEIGEADLLIPPRSFRIFTSDAGILKGHYPRAVESALITTDLPALPDDEGSLAILDSSGRVMDHFYYTDDYHVAFLKDVDGVSLERISLDAETNNGDNWRSASQAENFATPGYKNSASADGIHIAAGEVAVDPEIFSPQEPPHDFTRITYRFDHSGQVANATIYDHQGRVIKVLANNEVLGVEGFFRWDGDRDDGSRARAGYYVAMVEVFDAHGVIGTFRKRVVIAYR